MLSVSDFNDFEVFAVVADEGSLRKAAARLSTSQPLVSQRITRLERNLGTSLIERSTNGIRLTDAGRRLVPYLKRALGLMNEAIAAVRDASTTEVFEVWTDATLAPVVMPFVTRAIDGLPMTLSNRAAPVTETIRAVREGDADVGFVYGDARTELLLVEPFFKDELCFVVQPEHPLALRAAVTVADVIEHEVAVAMCAPGGEIAANHLTVAGIPSERLRRVTPASTATMLALDNGHVCACLRSSVERSLELGLVTELTGPDLPNWVVEIRLVFRPADVDRAPVRTLRDAVCAAWDRKSIH